MSHQRQLSAVGLSVEIAVSLLLIFLIVAWCLQIVAPFVGFVAWGAIIAISVYNPYRSLRDRIGSKLALALFTGIGLGLVLVPAWMFGGSLFDSVTQFYNNVQSGEFDIPQPDPRVEEWLLVGDKLFAAWSVAAQNFEQFLESYSEQLKNVASFAAGKVAGIGLTILLFMAATVIAAVMLSNDETVKAAMLRFCRRLVGDRAQDLLDLSVATIRSVTVGVLGIALIQALGTGLGMWLVGVPFSGVWALLVLVLVIAQLPALLVMLPVILWVFSVESTGVATVFAVWSVAVSMSDIALKPMLLGRGVEAPMLVILLGAIGGMILSGIIGLFVGAVVLALGYKLFQVWLEVGDPAPTVAETADSDPS